MSPLKRNVAAVILAAGGSSRMGTPKQLLSWGSSTLLQHAIDAADEACDSVNVVLGAYEQQLAASIPERCGIIMNPEWRSGLHSSIRAAVQHLQRDSEIAAVLLMTVDQPYVTSTLLRQLIDAHQCSSCKIAASQYADTLGIPALFSAELFSELIALREHGAKEIIKRYLPDVARCPFPQGEIDLDTPENYQEARKSAVSLKTQKILDNSKS